jgi:glycosyltransferase involved in cell wall biosynthesis
MANLVPPLISIIVPCYNQGCFLDEALNSVIAQSYVNWECIIVNDGSTDKTAEIAQSYIIKDKRFKYTQQLNAGLSNARNTGIRKASGDYIQLLDADDLIEPNKLSLSVNFYESGMLADKTVVYSSMRYFEHAHPEILKIVGRNNFVAHIELKEEDGINNQKELIVHRNPFVISAPLYPSLLFIETGYFDEDMNALEDWDFHIRCNAAGYKFHHFYDQQSRTLIRLHNSSMMRNQQLLDENFNKVNFKHNLIDITTAINTSPNIIKACFNNIKRFLFSK